MTAPKYRCATSMKIPHAYPWSAQAIKTEGIPKMMTAHPTIRNVRAEKRFTSEVRST
jgi:hypothetical protein